MTDSEQTTQPNSTEFVANESSPVMNSKARPTNWDSMEENQKTHFGAQS